MVNRLPSRIDNRCSPFSKHLCPGGGGVHAEKHSHRKDSSEGTLGTPTEPVFYNQAWPQCVRKEWKSESSGREEKASTKGSAENLTGEAISGIISQGWSIFSSQWKEWTKLKVGSRRGLASRVRETPMGFLRVAGE